MSSPSPLRSSPSKTNGAKLSRLLVDDGTATLQKVFNSYHPPVKLQAVLNSNYATLQGLFRSRKINRQQWDLLFPPVGGGQPDSSKFDITLLSILFRNICGLSPPGDPVWNNKPVPTDKSREADLVRIRLFRNELYGHVTTTGIDDPLFGALWEELSEVLVRLGADKSEIDRLKDAPIDEDEYIDLLTEWKREEDTLKDQLQEINSKLDQLCTSSQKTPDLAHQTAAPKLAAAAVSTEEVEFQNGDVTFFCKKCNVRACQARHVLYFREKCHVIHPDNIRGEVVFKLHPQREEFKHGMRNICKVHCKKCKTCWGTKGAIHEREWIKLSVRGFFIDRGDGSKRMENWQWEDVRFKFPEFKEGEVDVDAPSTA